jgi:hypothetical protein
MSICRTRRRQLQLLRLLAAAARRQRLLRLRLLAEAARRTRLRRRLLLRLLAAAVGPCAGTGRDSKNGRSWWRSRRAHPRLHLLCSQEASTSCGQTKNSIRYEQNEHPVMNEHKNRGLLRTPDAKTKFNTIIRNLLVSGCHNKVQYRPVFEKSAVSSVFMKIYRFWAVFPSLIYSTQ